MSSNIYSTGNYGSPSLGSHCHVPVTSPTTFYTASMNCGDSLCLPSQNRTWLLDNFLKTYGKPSSYQQSSCGPTTYETSCYLSTTYCASRPCRGISFFPIGSYLSSSCQPSMYNRHQNCLSSRFHPQKHFSYGCQPQNFISCGYRPLNFVSSACHPLRYLSYDCQPLSYVFSSFRPLDSVSSRFQPVLYIYKSFQPACSFGTWQTPFVRRSC
uniref:keratin-associated protein 26-1 n=1 Tax=Odobenus rosmarus divergens TaxID=9708 RepID=UPI00063CC93F|nr:PREDICTED: keratin-associated protein 26-1 [Odobenus rosmarus divergens]